MMVKSLSWSLPALAIAGLMMFACQPGVDVERESKALLNADMEFSRASVEHGAAEAFYRFLTDDAIQLAAGGEPVFGKEAIRNEMEAGVEVTLTWQPKHAEVARSGDMGWTWGTYVAKWQKDDGEGVSYGKYLNVWKKQPDGSWKVLVDMGNQNPPPAGESEPGS